MENSLFVNDTPTVRTPEQRSSVGVRGLFGDGLPSKDNNETSVTQSISVRTPKQGGTTCVGVRGITGEDLSSKVIRLSRDGFPLKDNAFKCFFVKR